MKPMPETSPHVQPGTFGRPSGAQLRSVPDKASLVEVWREVGSCLAYPKPDGWRFQVHKVGEVINLFSRTGKNWAKEFPSVVQMIQAQVTDEQVILDTELVGFDRHSRHLMAAKLRRAAKYRCYVLDALYLGGIDLTLLPAHERVSRVQKHLDDAFQGMLVFAEYTRIDSQEELMTFYESCRARHKDGFDGAIIKRHDAPYFTDVLKLKPEDTVDAVVVGAYLDKDQAVMSLLLVIPDHQHKCWVPLGKVSRARGGEDWDTVWTACQRHMRNSRPNGLENPPDLPDIWIAPEVVVEITLEKLRPSRNYLVSADYARKCTLREDKGPEEATPLEQILQIAGAVRKPHQLSFFEAMDADAADQEIADRPG